VQVTETVEITGHLMDSGILSQVLDDIREYSGDFVIEKLDVGHGRDDPSYARILVSSDDEEIMQRLLMRLQTKGVNPTDPEEATLEVAVQDGVFPDAFYSTTNL
jgi:hypothetical protein